MGLRSLSTVRLIWSSAVRKPTTWPNKPGTQQMQLHLDIGVLDLEAEVARAEGLGAQQAAWQPQDDVRVLHDPAGHVFCLFLPGA